MQERAATVAALVSVFGGVPAFAAATQYRFVDLTPTGITDAEAHGSVNGFQVGYVELPGRIDHAYIWAGTAVSGVDVHPAGYTQSAIHGVDGGTQVGIGSPSGAPFGSDHAMLWRSTASSAVDLHPAGASRSFGLFVFGNQQVGGAQFPTHTNQHAALWNGTASSFVDLNPTGYRYSEARATDGVRQVGTGVADDGSVHALLWKGSAQDYVDLTPAGKGGAYALGMSGAQQVGVVHGPNQAYAHGALWSGSAASFVDLTPNLAPDSQAALLATNGSVQVGSINRPLTPDVPVKHAMRWAGTADSQLDLHDFVIGGFTDSVAYAVAADGTIVGTAFNLGGVEHAVMWIPVPEPTITWSVAMTVALTSLRRRRLTVRP